MTRSTTGRRGERGVIPVRAVDPGGRAVRRPDEVDATRVATDYFTEVAELARRIDLAAVG